MPEKGRRTLLLRLERLLGRLEDMLEVDLDAPVERLDEALAYRWRQGRLEPIHHPDLYPLEGLLGVERSVERLRRNVAAFCAGRPALDVLLYGERGTGKSSAVRGLLHDLAPQGLRLVEVRREDLPELPRIYAALRGRTERFGLFCDDLSFEADELWYKALKAMLDGGLEARPANVLLLATSNRRHLMPESSTQNREARVDAAGELHPGETAEEKLSLSDRFGLLLPFFSFDQARYLEIVDHHAAELGLRDRVGSDELHARALRFALERGGRSGRTARQACIEILQQLETP